MVDFKKMLEDRQNHSLIIPLGLSIQTTDGQDLTLPPDASVADLLPGGGGAPLPRITAGQPRDERFPDGRDQLYLIQSSLAVNEAGEQERIKEFAGPFGKALIVRPVGFTLNRSLMPKYDPRAAASGNPDANKPLCRSENFLAPDAQFAGKFSTVCAKLNTASGKLIGVCPYARWGEKDENGKSAPPACNETYVVCVAFIHQDEWVVAECYFKSASAAAGKTLVQQLRGLQHKGLPLYAYPVELVLKEAGIGNTYTGRLMLPNLLDDQNTLLPEADEIPALEEASARWQEALRVRAERAARVLETTDSQASAPSAVDVMDGAAEPAAQAAESRPAPMGTALGSNGGTKKNGKKAMI